LATKGFFGECQNNSGKNIGIDWGTIGHGLLWRPRRAACRHCPRCGTELKAVVRNACDFNILTVS
jgi:hypothetical protein